MTLTTLPPPSVLGSCWATKLHGIAQRGQSKLFFSNPRAACHSSCRCTSSSSIKRNSNGPSFCRATAAGMRTALGGRICTGAAGRPAIAVNGVFSSLSVTQWSCSKACLIRTDFICQTPMLYAIAHPNTIQYNIFYPPNISRPWNPAKINEYMFCKIMWSVRGQKMLAIST
jgi:hypothetical protein